MCHSNVVAASENDGLSFSHMSIFKMKKNIVRGGSTIVVCIIRVRYHHC
jgi:hypothetical protein